MADDSLYKWYYHGYKSPGPRSRCTKEGNYELVNETREAIRACLANNCGLLVWVCKPGCEVCHVVWYDIMKVLGKDQGEWPTKFKAWNLIGLKIDDTFQHVMALHSGMGSFKNTAIGTWQNGGSVPWVFLCKVNETSLSNSSINTLKKYSNLVRVYGVLGPRSWTATTLDDFVVPLINHAEYQADFAVGESTDDVSTGEPNLISDMSPGDYSGIIQSLDPTIPGGVSDDTYDTLEDVNMVYDTTEAIVHQEYPVTKAMLTVDQTKYVDIWLKFYGEAGLRYHFIFNFKQADDSRISLTDDGVVNIYPVKDDAGRYSLVPSYTGNNRETTWFSPTRSCNYYINCRVKRDNRIPDDAIIHLELQTSRSADRGTVSNPMIEGIEPGRWTIDHQAIKDAHQPFILYYLPSPTNALPEYNASHDIVLADTILSDTPWREMTRDIPGLVLTIGNPVLDYPRFKENVVKPISTQDVDWLGEIDPDGIYVVKSDETRVIDRVAGPSLAYVEPDGDTYRITRIVGNLSYFPVDTDFEKLAVDTAKTLLEAPAEPEPTPEPEQDPESEQTG